MSPFGAARLAKAREEYVDALCALNRLRCTRRGASDYGTLLNQAQRRLAEATAEWTATFKRETGQKLAG